MQAHIPRAPGCNRINYPPVLQLFLFVRHFLVFIVSIKCLHVSPSPRPLHMPSFSLFNLTPILRLSSMSSKMRSLLWVSTSSLYHDTASLLLGLCFKCFILIRLSCPRDCELPVVSKHIYHCASPELALCLLEGAGWILGINRQLKSPCRALERLVGGMMVSPKERFCPYNWSLF